MAEQHARLLTLRKRAAESGEVVTRAGERAQEGVETRGLGGDFLAALTGRRRQQVDVPPPRGAVRSVVAAPHAPCAHQPQRSRLRRRAANGVTQALLRQLRGGMEGDELPTSRHARVRAPGAAQAQRTPPVEQRQDGLLQAALHCGLGCVGLPRKTRERGTIVGEGEPPRDAASCRRCPRGRCHPFGHVLLARKCGPAFDGRSNRLAHARPRALSRHRLKGVLTPASTASRPRPAQARGAAAHD